MARSFQIVEDKVREANFFLKKLEETEDIFTEAQYYISAFLSASRSITFTIQASMKGIPKFENWYQSIQEELRRNELAKYFLFARNHSQKVGFYPIGGGSFGKDKKGNNSMKLWFTPFYPKEKELIPEIDVVSACNEYFKMILEIVQQCYVQFEEHIDLNIRYTKEGMRKLGFSIEDIEEENDYPRGWTSYLPIDNRIELFWRQNFNPGIDEILVNYLGKDRYEKNTAANRVG